MSLLTLVRHGQASYMAENYDKLSPLGELQARKLGEFWLQREVTFDLVVHGPAQRHIRTGEIVADVYRRAGAFWPEPTIVKDLDEFDAAVLIRNFLPALAEKHGPIREMDETFRKRADSPDAGLLLERLFEAVAHHWSIATVHSPEMETWAQFETRVRRGIEQIRSAAPKSSSTVVFTSGGPVAATIAIAQDLAPNKALDLVWVTRNSSFSQFLFSGDRFSLSCFNTHPHLDDRAQLTYR